MKKKQFKNEYIFFTLFLVIIICFFSFCINFVLDRFVEKSQPKTSISEVSIDWEKIYPFNNGSKESNDGDSSTINQDSVVNDLNFKYKNVLERVSNYVSANSNYLVLNDQMKTVGVKTKKLLNNGVRFSQNGIQQLDNGQMINVESQEADGYADDMIDNLKFFNDYLNEKDIPLVYIQPMVKYDESEKYISFVNENRDIILNKLNNAGIDTLDLRKLARQDGLTVNDVFYKTDHHWTTATGLWASQNIVKYVDSKYNLRFNEEILSKDNFELKNYKNSMFGSYGNVAGQQWACVEDHLVYYPKFDTYFNCEIPNKNINNSGTFAEVLFNNEKIEELTNSNAGYIYETTCFGNTPYTKIVNQNNTRGPKVLLIRDSFALAIMPYLACSCSEVTSIDLRKSNGNFTGSVETLVDEYKPDIVIIVYNQFFNTSFK